MESLSARRITRSGMVAAIYVVATISMASLSYGSVQFRVAEALMLLCLYSKDYIYSLTLGCFLSNVLSTVGAVDTVVGTLATLFAGLCIYLLRDHLNLVTASIFPIAFNAVFVGLELRFVAHIPLVMAMAGVALGEFVCVTFVGSILFKILSTNKAVMKMLSDDIDSKSSVQ